MCINMRGASMQNEHSNTRATVPSTLMKISSQDECINQMGWVNLSMKRMCGFEVKNNGLWALSLAIQMHLGKIKDTLEILKHM